MMFRHRNVGKMCVRLAPLEPFERGKSMEMPPVGVVVKVTLEHWFTKGTQEAELIHVDEDDVDWRTADNSELSYDWNVISWREK